MNGNYFEIIERCKTYRGEIQLQRRGTEYEIISNGTFLMATYNGGSEKLLVKAALDACENDLCSVLIGGLGVGYSLAEAVCHPRTQQVTVIEPNGVVSIWSASSSPEFMERLKVHFPLVEALEIEHDRSAEPDIVYITKLCR